jgi:hypothetical protein
MYCALLYVVIMQTSAIVLPRCACLVDKLEFRSGVYSTSKGTPLRFPNVRQTRNHATLCMKKIKLVHVVTRQLGGSERRYEEHLQGNLPMTLRQHLGSGHMDLHSA